MFKKLKSLLGNINPVLISKMSGLKFLDSGNALDSGNVRMDLIS